MFKILYRSMFAFSLLFLISCEKDFEEFVPSDGSVTNTVNILGMVTDDQNNPVEDAFVQFGGQEVFTNKFGVYQFDNAQIDSRHNFINITKEGYFENTKTFRGKEGASILLESQLIPKVFDRSFNSNNGGQVSKGNVSITFTSESIMEHSSKENYSGEVQVAVHYLNPTDPLITEMMPGDLSATNAEDIYSALTSYGMVFVELQSPSGVKLQLKEGSTARMESEIDSKLLAEAPSTIKMWSFDYSLGLWVEEGSAQLEGSKYVGEVSHFSCWNYDADLPSIILTGRVIDEEGKPVTNVHVWVSVAGTWGGGHGNTNFDGTFGGAVSKDEILTFRIKDNCSNATIYTAEIGPFSTDTDIGDIVVSVLYEAELEINATFVNCDGDPMTNGLAYIGGKVYKIEDSEFNTTIRYCSSITQMSMRVVDLDALKETLPISLDLSGPNNLGTVSVCEIDIFHLGINIPDLEIEELAVIETFATSGDTLNMTGKQLFGYSSEQNLTFVNIRYDDMTQGGFSTGTFAITGGNISGARDGMDYSLDFIDGQVIVTEVNQAEKYIAGSYTANVDNTIDGVISQCFGTFKLHANW